MTVPILDEAGDAKTGRWVIDDLAWSREEHFGNLRYQFVQKEKLPKDDFLRSSGDRD